MSVSEKTLKSANRVRQDKGFRRKVFTSRFFQRLGGGFLERIMISFISGIQLRSLSALKSRNDIEVIRRAKKMRHSLLLGSECFSILSMARAYAKSMSGAIAEVGTFQGCSARIICEVKDEAKCYLCDTFEGLPDLHQYDRAIHKKGQYAASLESVRDVVKDYPNVHFVKGFFPDAAQGRIPEDERFSFVHLDVDLYEGTLKSLEYFYPRLLPGAAVVVHDYSVLTGVEQAVHEFCDAHRDIIFFELATTQAVLIKPGIVPSGSESDEKILQDD